MARLLTLQQLFLLCAAFLSAPVLASTPFDNKDNGQISFFWGSILLGGTEIGFGVVFLVLEFLFGLRRFFIRNSENIRAVCLVLSWGTRLGAFVGAYHSHRTTSLYAVSAILGLGFLWSIFYRCLTRYNSVTAHIRPSLWFWLFFLVHMIFDVASLAALFFAHYVSGEMGKYELVLYTVTLLPSLGCLMLVGSFITFVIPCHHEGSMRKENACKCIRLPESFKGDDVVRRQVVGFADL